MIWQERYKGYYKDEHGCIDISIENNSDRLSFNIGSMCFESCDFIHWSLLDYSSYTKEELARYSFSHFLNSETRELCDCTIGVFLPITVVNVNSDQEKQVYLHIEIENGKSNPIRGGVEFFKCFLECKELGIERVCKSDFEFMLLYLQEKLGKQYYLKNCFGCLYSDYSIYGNDTFGTMLCFIDNKEKYLKASGNKMEYADVKCSKAVQEIYYCDQFCKREPNTGYRG